MVGIIIASHGKLAEGILQSGEMVFGIQEDCVACTLMPDESPEAIKNKMEEALASFENQDEVLFLVDLWGGTPFNQARQLISEYEDKWALVTGVNLSMLIEAYALRNTMNSAHEIAANLLKIAREGIKVCPSKLEVSVSELTDKKEIKFGAIPEGTMLGDGQIKFVLARIDTRLLHGQVATAWTKAVMPNRIIVVSDSVSKDELRKSMIEQVAPPGVKAHVVPVKKIIEVSKDVRFGLTKALLLFETPQDALRAIEGGVKISELNLGSMAHTNGKVVCSDAVSMDKNDVETIEKLISMGVRFDVRKVPADSPERIEDLLQKAKVDLA